MGHPLANKMKKKPYIPSKNAEKVTWANNYKTEIPTDGATCGLSPAEITAQTTAAQGIITEVNAIEAAKSACKSAIENSTTALKGHINVIRTGVKQMKVNSGYTAGIGDNLGIIGEEQTIDVATAKPVLKISKVPTGYQIDFNLLDFFDGIHLYRRRPTDAAFSYKATDTTSPYVDTDTMVDGTEYQAFFLLEDDEVGQPSDIIKVKL
jgi:hypothetical protein